MLVISCLKPTGKNINDVRFAFDILVYYRILYCTNLDITYQDHLRKFKHDFEGGMSCGGKFC